jgi:hypothetical protein
MLGLNRRTIGATTFSKTVKTQFSTTSIVPLSYPPETENVFGNFIGLNSLYIILFEPFNNYISNTTKLK